MSEFRIFVVDDEEMMTDLMDAILSPHFQVEIFRSAEDCLEAIESRRKSASKLPRLVVLDVGLPGVSGYECCRLIRELDSDLPVIFVSGHDTIEARIEGYDAGGDDFVVKPFDTSELLRKIRVFARIEEKKSSLAEQVTASEQLSTLALASMDESGLVLQFMSKAIGCASPEELAEALLHLLRGYRLEGAVQLRYGGTSFNLSGEGANRPLESSVLDHVRTLGRIFEFKTRSVYNFGNVTVMVSNMPVGDPYFCGRIRDNLAIAAAGADARLAAMETEVAERKRFEANRRALERIKATVRDLGAAQAAQQKSGGELSQELQERLAKSYVQLGLTENQERYVTDMVQGTVDRMAAIFDQGEQTRAMLDGLIAELESAG